MEEDKKYIYYIYKIIHEDIENNLTYIYTGSTKDIYDRRRRHIISCNNPKNKDYNHYKYIIMRELGLTKFKMVVLEKTNEITNKEARIKEEEIRKNLNCNKNIINLNSCKCYNTQKEYNKENKERLNEAQKLYRQQHKEEKRLYDINYKQEHREKYLASKRAYYQKHKATHNNYKKD